MATPDHTPKGRGFDSSFGYFHHANDYFTEQQASAKDLTSQICGIPIVRLVVKMERDQIITKKGYSKRSSSML